MFKGEIAIIGAATSAGAHHAGQERAPAALRQAGFVTRLKAAGIDVADLGDVVDSTFTQDSMAATARGLPAVVMAARRVADVVERVVAEGRVPIVLGGDCTITVGVVAGIQRHDPGCGLLYFDGDADLATPESSTSGVMDAMGIAHLLGITDNPLARLGAQWPMLADTRLVLFGYNEIDPEAFRESVLDERPGLVRFPDRQVRADPTGCASAALAALTRAAERMIVHFDVDAVDSRDLPLGNFPHYGTGVSLADAAEALTAFYEAPQFSAAVLTEVNPSYEPSGIAMTRYVDAVAGALTRALTAP